MSTNYIRLKIDTETLWKTIKEEQAKTEADLGEEPDLSQDDAIDDMDGIANYYSQEGYAKGLRFALNLIRMQSLNDRPSLRS